MHMYIISGVELARNELSVQAMACILAVKRLAIGRNSDDPSAHYVLTYTCASHTSAAFRAAYHLFVIDDWHKAWKLDQRICTF